LGRERAAWQVRSSDGKIRTVTAFSHKGAVASYLESFDPEVGEVLDVKLRGAPPDDEDDGWRSFKIKDDE
jgi:hypothetical protein